MKEYIKRYWHNVPFIVFAIRAVLLGCMTCGLTALLYFLFFIVPTEKIHYQNNKFKQEFKIKNNIA